MGEILREIGQPEHAHAFDQIAKRFVPMFSVSLQAMRIRLEKLGLLLREVPDQRTLTGGV
jgi:hypothetical protein